MNTTIAAKAIRKHLLKYWKDADKWSEGTLYPVEEAEQWPHRECLITHKPVGSVRFYSQWLPVINIGSIHGNILSLLRDEGKESVLAYLDTLILGGIK